jgi:hypothetical protein
MHVDPLDVQHLPNEMADAGLDVGNFAMDATCQTANIPEHNQVHETEHGKDEKPDSGTHTGCFLARACLTRAAENADCRSGRGGTDHEQNHMPLYVG